MLEILKFIFSDFWIFLGVAVLVAIILDGIRVIIKQINRNGRT